MRRKPPIAMACPSCGRPAATDDRFCGGCGTALPRACPVCGITFYEFRNQGRLGCPHDYVFFEKELDPLIMNIHGETTHTGKRPTSSGIKP